MYFTPNRTLSYLQSLLSPSNNIITPKNRSRLLLALIPDFLTLYPCAEILKQYESTSLPEETGTGPESGSDRGKAMLLGAQDCFWESEGAYTGEVSPASISAIGASIVELGHAERRRIFGETDDTTAAKAKAATAEGLIPLVCIGEITSPGDDAGQAVRKAVDEVKPQVTSILDAVPASAPVIFAYEPVWAIGQPVPAGVDHVAAVVDGVRSVIGGHVSRTGGAGGEVRVLYGGSAGPGLWGEGGLGKAVDGMFLGRFAHEVEGVRRVVREVEESLVD